MLEQTALDLELESGDSCEYVWFGHIEVEVECVGSYKLIKDVPPKYNVDAPRWDGTRNSSQSGSLFVFSDTFIVNCYS